jgi:arylsulfatase A-like enzyme
MTTGDAMLRWIMLPMIALMGISLSGRISCVAGEATEAQSEKKKPNILLIVIDTLRRDHVGCFGYKRDTTPHLDQLAKEGVRCDQMIATSSWTIPSLMSIFTSLPPSLHNATSYQKKLASGTSTLAEELKKFGYQTAAVVSNPSASPTFGFNKGFDFYDDYTVTLGSDLNLFGEHPTPQSIRTIRTSPTVNRVALNWLEKVRKPDQPFFLFLLYVDPHADYIPPPPYDTMFDPDYKGTVRGNMYDDPKRQLSDEDKEHIKALYDGEIRYTDEHVGQVLKKLDDLGLSKDTVVVAAADHGEEFWDHGGILHGHSLFDELIRVPFIIRWPGNLPTERVVPDQLSNISIMPTLLEMAGAKNPTQCQGPSLVGILSGKRALTAQFAFSETEAEEKNLRSVRSPSEKLIADLKEGGRCVYDLTKDVREQTGAPNGSKILATRFDEWSNALDKGRKERDEAQKVNLDERLIEQLREMGYSQ